MPQFWGGFTDGKLDTIQVDTGCGGWGEHFTRAPALFASYDDARHRYEDVRKVEVKIVGK